MEPTPSSALLDRLALLLFEKGGLAQEKRKAKSLLLADHAFGSSGALR
jgi:hypothetical protein